MSKVSHIVRAASLLSALLLCSCGTMGRVLNPFYEPPTELAQMGERNDRALYNENDKGYSARAALEAMSSYQRANAPQPNNPVIQPAVVRLMWVPDHLNKNGDLVPAHYYYLKVLKDRWAVTDAFELEGQLGSTRSGSNLPFVNNDKGN